ncbi:hypothetical protein BJV82DRAFT_601610 [Fennellomyces sp. T-0311]|nr:hypothetical protein BJV82DRAFT_601610 [Fennellomyces sp. T-0311]
MVKKSPGRKPKQTLPGQQCIDLRWLRKGSNSASSSVSQSNTSPSNASPSNTLHSNTSSGTAESRFNTISNVIQNDNDNVPFDSAVENEDQTHSSDMQTLSDFMHEVELGDRNQNAEEHERNDDCETDMQDTGALTEQEELDRYGPESLDNEGIVASYLRKVRDEKIKGIAKYYRQKNKFWIEPDPVFHCLDGRPLDSTVLYYPRIFVWLPDLLVPEKLCCPHCNAILHKDGLSTDPPARRVVDIDSCFYILSQRYRCSKCPKSFSAHEEKILSSLPFHIQSIFPAYLTHKSGISKALFDLMRPCYQNALGPERLHNLLYELHTLKHSRLELDYLNTIAFRLSNPQIQDNFASNVSHIPFSTFDDPKGYAGFVPSATYLRLVYTSLIDQLRPLIEDDGLGWNYIERRSYVQDNQAHGKNWGRADFLCSVHRV